MPTRIVLLLCVAFCMALLSLIAPQSASARRLTYKQEEAIIRNWERIADLIDKNNNDSLIKAAALCDSNAVIYKKAKQFERTQASENMSHYLKGKANDSDNKVKNIIIVVFIVLLVFLIIKGFYDSHAASLRIEKRNEKIREQRDMIYQEKSLSDDLLLNILPRSVAEELKATNHFVPQSYARATVLFTDFKGFTAIAQELSPEQIIEELNNCFIEFDKIVERNNLEKIKTIGDAYMCAGGLPEQNHTNPQDAVRAALEMQQWMENWRREKIAAGQPVWELRIGIHTGPLVAGVIGKNKFSYDVWGDTVNTAARMESSGEQGRVNISDTVYEIIKYDFNCEDRGLVEAKGKGLMHMYFVLSEK